ncbi:MAG TPA: BT_3928 family protein [Chitinophagaceae bacterium]|nr:BT_3928 family protein [Chitinophagaceae bacterium]
MKIAINIIRIFVALLFIFSGLVKANDPLGTAYKMEEYFEVWTTDLTTSGFFLKDTLMNLFHFLNGHTLFLSVTMNAFEIIAGAALLFGWRMKLFSWLLLLLMIFFTILTGYTYKTGRPTNCGCFGDCIKITPEYSFYKDLLLSALILIILFTRKHIRPLFSSGLNTSLMLLVTIFSFGLQWYALRYLPPVDCLPFKKGNNIPEKMKMPANAVPDSIVMTFVYEKQGKKVEFTADKFPTDFNDSLYKFVNRYDKVVRKGKNNEPPIKGFSLTSANSVDSTGIENMSDSTGVILSQPNALLLFNTNVPDKNPAWKNGLLAVYSEANKKGIPFYFVSTNRDSANTIFSQMGFKNITVLNCDFTAIRTSARANPTLYYLKQGTVAGKWSYARFNDALEAIKK